MAKWGFSATNRSLIKNSQLNKAEDIFQITTLMSLSRLKTKGSMLSFGRKDISNF